MRIAYWTNINGAGSTKILVIDDNLIDGMSDVRVEALVNDIVYDDIFNSLSWGWKPTE